jgi:hypothetical protein
MDDDPVTSKQVANPSIDVLLPNGNTMMQSTHTAKLDIFPPYRRLQSPHLHLSSIRITHFDGTIS